jgi:hypothetical protein
MGTRSTIASLTEDSNEARACSRWLAPIRDAALRAYNWEFAKKTVALALVTGAPETPGFLYTYGAPSDMIKARYIPVGNRAFSGFDISLVNPGTGTIKAIRTDRVGALLVYTARVTNPSLWDPMFTIALAQLLASAIAIDLSGDTKVKTNCLQTGRAFMVEAQVADANESGPEIIDPLPDWLAVRDGYFIDFDQEFPNFPYRVYTL